MKSENEPAPPPKNSRPVTSLALGLLALLLALVGFMAIPRFVRPRARETSAVSPINNLRIIESAKEQWALENKKSPGAAPTADDIAPYLKNNKLPDPAYGENYVINPIGIPAHAITPRGLGKIPPAGKITIP